MAGPGPPLTDHRQIEQIVRLRLAGVPHKVVARQVGCTPGQVQYWWRHSFLYKPDHKRSAGAKRRHAREVPERQATRQAKTAAAAAARAREIAEASKEPWRARFYEPAPLEW